MWPCCPDVVMSPEACNLDGGIDLSLEDCLEYISCTGGRLEFGVGCS